MEVTALTTYPIKSCYRVEATVADVEPWGLAGDRRWLITDESGTVLTQRKLPALGRIRPAYTGTGLHLNAAGVDGLAVPFPGGEPQEVELGRSKRILATPAGAAADAWIGAVIGRDAHLYHLDDPTRRPVDPRYGRPDDRVSLADAYPLLLASEASLTAVGDWLVEDGEEPVPMTRFRPNVVVAGAPAWAEDEWVGRRVWLGAVPFRVAKPCDRCVLTTIDPETGEKGHEPLRVLGRHRRFPDGLMFGVNLIPDGTGPLRVGDPARLE